MTAIAEREHRIASVGYEYDAAAREPVNECNLCGSAHLIEVSRRDRYGYPAVFRVCARCGLGFLSPRLTSAEYGHFYDSIYRPLVSAYHGRTIDAVTVQDEQREYASELLKYLTPALGKPPMTVMDLGGSTGVVGGAVGAASGARVTVLDPSPAELAVAEAQGMETIPGFIEEYDPAGRTWDLILLCQTIDHLLDPIAAINAVARMIAPEGRAFVDVLDVLFMCQRRGSIEGAVKIDHPFYLTRDTARGYFDKAGLEVVSERLSHDGHWGFLLARADVRDPDWASLARARDRFLEEVWRLRASG